MGMMKPYSIFHIIGPAFCVLALSQGVAVADTKGKDWGHYQVIVDRSLFGKIIPPPPPVTNEIDSSLINLPPPPPPGPSLADTVKITALTRFGGRAAVGFTDGLSGRSFYMREGEAVEVPGVPTPPVAPPPGARPPPGAPPVAVKPLLAPPAMDVMVCWTVISVDVARNSVVLRKEETGRAEQEETLTLQGIATGSSNAMANVTMAPFAQPPALGGGAPQPGGWDGRGRGRGGPTNAWAASSSQLPDNISYAERQRLRVEEARKRAEEARQKTAEVIDQQDKRIEELRLAAEQKKLREDNLNRIRAGQSPIGKFELTPEEANQLRAEGFDVGGTPAPVPAPAPAPMSHKSYVTQEGDDIYSIAVRMGVPPAELRQANNLTSSEVAPGQTLRVPVK